MSDANEMRRCNKLTSVRYKESVNETNKQKQQLLQQQQQILVMSNILPP